MKRITFAISVLLLSCMYAFSSSPETEFIEGKDLTLIGKLLPTPDRYSRVDTLKYTGFTDYQRRDLNQESAGLALVFKTNSDRISVKFDYKKRNHFYNSTDIASAGAGLYIRRNGKWLYAGSGVPSENGKAVDLVANMEKGEKECLLYLPLRSIINEVQVGVSKGSEITPIPNPFRHKIVFWGSSFTHGVSASRSGMAYPLQLQRATGLNICSLGVNGNSKLQQSYARLLADTDADAFVFDAFSNPNAASIRELFDDFVKTIREKHPDTPIIFQQTIYRGNRNFDKGTDERESEKIAAAEEVVKKAMERDANIYFIHPVADLDGNSSTDKIHPSDLGYSNWMNSIKQDILDILKKYNIE